VREDARFRQQQHVMVERANDDLPGIGRQSGAKLKMRDLRRHASVSKRDAQDSLGEGTNP
jgi:hypothetical protein